MEKFPAMRCIGTLLLFSLLGFPQRHAVPVEPFWFPAEGARLEAALDPCFAEARKRSGTASQRRGLLGLIVPHAALEYSGTIAAEGYLRLGRPANVILLGFSHSRALRGIAAPDLDAYETPAGEIRVNRQALRELRFPEVPERQLCDHALENQLPFLQRAAPGTAVIPLYVGELRTGELDGAARKLADRLRRGDVIVASSDLTHYGAAYRYTPFPDDTRLPSRLRERAMRIFDWAGALDVREFDRFLARTGDNLCGRGPIRLLMAALRQLQQDVYASPIGYLASGELTGSYALSVGYGALGFYPAASFFVSSEDGRKLLASAQGTLSQYLAGRQKVLVPVPLEQRDSALDRRAAVFVTVRQRGKLRGSMGTLVPALPLADAVADRTVAALRDDPRFPPVHNGETGLTLEVSVLTPLKRIGNWKGFRAGQGAAIFLRDKWAASLPEAATDTDRGREQFLEDLSRKAGLSPRAYLDSRARLYVYGAQVFSETTSGAGQAFIPPSVP